MVQHLLIGFLWPPLMLVATPDWLMRRIVRLPVISTLAAFFTLPVIAISIFNFDVYLWHLPLLYDVTLESEPVHIIEHLSFMGLGLLNWWPILTPVREQRLSYPLQILYLFADGMLMMVLGIVFTFAPTSFYPTYEAAPRLWGMSASSDQQIGGLIMWYPGNLPYAAMLVIAFYRWFDGDEPARPETKRVQSHTIGPPGP
jgi:putative membrane protein